MAQTPAQSLVQGVLDPPLEVQVQRGGVAYDFTGSTNIQFRVKPANGCRAASVTTADVVDARGGFLTHGWLAVETQSPGLLLVQVTWTDPAGEPQAWPDDDYVRARVTPFLR